jgi:tRNA/rRNA methyltransferase
MPGAGTDHTRDWPDRPGPVVILVEPQLPENMGAVARAMANFGLARLRFVAPRQSPTHPKAKAMASGAHGLLEDAPIFDTLADALADVTYAIATTARAHDQVKPVVGADDAARLVAPKALAGETVALVFGRERNGLENPEVALCDAILTLPVNPAFASLNLAQAVIIVAYEWFRHATDGALPYGAVVRSDPAPKAQIEAFFVALDRDLDATGFYRPPEKRDVMRINLRNMIGRMEPTQQDIQTLHGVLTALARGRPAGPLASTLAGTQGEALRDVLAKAGGGTAESGHSPLRGLSRLMRRNPPPSVRALWDALKIDRRFAGKGFRRQVPVGPHVPDFVSFPLRAAIEVADPTDSAETLALRATRRDFLTERGYQVVTVMPDLDAEGIGAALETIAQDLSLDGVG